MTKKALLIGINYRNTSSALNGCINDVLNMKALLISNLNYLEENITLLTDDTPIKPTKQNIQAQLIAFIQSAIEGDQLYLHYSGHGSNMPDLSRDESDGRDELLVPLDYPTAGFIPDDWMLGCISKLNPKAKLNCCFDSCHSGTVLDLRYNVKSIKDNQYTFAIERQSIPVNASVCMFSGCQDPQTSADAYINKTPQGAFTACFIDAVKANAAKPLKMREMLQQINNRLIENNFEQRSQLSVCKLEDVNKGFEL